MAKMALIWRQGRMPMNLDHVLLEKKDGVARITINRPEIDNAMTTQTFREIGEAFRDTEADQTIGVVVLTGAGDKAFSVGGVVSDHLKRGPGTHRLHFGQLVETSTIMRNLGKPIIAAVNGHAIGSAQQLQLLCDLSIASDRAVFAQHGSKRAGAPLIWGTQLLTYYVGERKAREMIFLSREYSAAEAVEMGLINKVVPHDKLYQEVDVWCQEILAKSPTSLRILKVSLNYKSDMAYPAMYHAREMLDLFSGTEERMEGTRAFVEGRQPDFSKFRK